jgi:hypothetical protein
MKRLKARQPKAKMQLKQKLDRESEKKHFTLAPTTTKSGIANSNKKKKWKNKTK